MEKATAKFSRFSLPNIKRIIPQLLANKLVGIQPLTGGATLGVPAPSEFTEAIALWVQETYPQLGFKYDAGIGYISLYEKDQEPKDISDCLAIAVIHCQNDCCRINYDLRSSTEKTEVLIYEHPDFFEQLAAIIDKALIGEEEDLFEEIEEPSENESRIKPRTDDYFIPYRFVTQNEIVRNRGPPLYMHNL